MADMTPEQQALLQALADQLVAAQINPGDLIALIETAKPMIQRNILADEIEKLNAARQVDWTTVQKQIDEKAIAFQLEIDGLRGIQKDKDLEWQSQISVKQAALEEFDKQLRQR